LATPDDLTGQLKELTRTISSLNNLLIKSNAINSSLAKNKGRRVNRADIAREYKNRGRRAFSPNANIDPMDNLAGVMDASTKRLADSYDNLASVSSQLDASTKQLSYSVSMLHRMTYAFKSFLPVGKNLVKMMPGAARGAGHFGWESTKFAGRMAAAPTRPLRSVGKSVTGRQLEFMQGGMGEPDSGWDAYKNLLFMGLGGLGKGFIPGTVAGATARGGLNRVFKGRGGKYKTPYSQTVKETAQSSLAGIRDAMGQMNQWWQDLPRSGKDGPLEFAPDQDFKDTIESLPTKIEKTNQILSGKDNIPLRVLPPAKAEFGIFGTEKQTKKWIDKFKEAMKGSIGDIGKHFSLGLNSVFGLKTAFSYIIPIFGAGYRSELPSPSYTRRHGVMASMLKTLGLIYLHARFASKESNDLILQLTRVTMAGLGVKGALRTPGARSISQWAGNAIRKLLFAHGA
jgi:hypothetical protein